MDVGTMWADAVCSESCIYLEERWGLVSNPPRAEAHTGECEEMACPVQTGYPICLCCRVFVLEEWGGSETVQEKGTCC